MPYTKDQLQAYWQANKEILNQKRREKRRLAKLGLAREEVSHERGKVSHLEVSQELAQVSHKSQMANLETANLNQVCYGKPKPEMANPENLKPVSRSQPNLKTANPKLEVSHGQPANGKPHSKMANPILAQLIQEWQTHTNYNCASGCSQNKYCSNCWYYAGEQLIDYKGGNHA